MIDIIYLFDSQKSHENLLPLSFTRPVADFRIGITTIKEKWEALFPARYSYYPVEYLREKYGSGGAQGSRPVYQRLRNPHQWADRGGGITACRAKPLSTTTTSSRSDKPTEDLENGIYTIKECKAEIRRIKYVFDIFLLNAIQINDDFFRITSHKDSMPADSTNTIIGSLTDPEGRQMLFVEEGANVCGATLNLKNYLYI